MSDENPLVDGGMSRSIKLSGSMEVLSQERRRQLGAYYTRGSLTKVLCKWAIRKRDDVLLEPSFGGCDFLVSAHRRLGDLGSPSPMEQLFGCDVDPAAHVEHLQGRLGVPAEAVGEGGDSIRFYLRDFLTLSREEMRPDGFDVVVANPPYVRHHELSAVQRLSANDITHSFSWLHGRANLWALFVTHAHTFLRLGGRAAWVLPGSALHADYAAPVIDATAKAFKRLLVVQLGERLFREEGAEESTVILLADGYGCQNSGSACLTFVEALGDLSDVIVWWQAGQNVGVPYRGRAAEALLDGSSRRWVSRIEEVCNVVRLGDLANIRIGIVTGANRMFVIDEPTARRHNLPEHALRPILGKMVDAPGLILTPEDVEVARAGGSRCLLVDTTRLHEEPKGSSLRRYLARTAWSVRRPNITFRKRTPWHRPDDGLRPDAFLSYMCGTGPRLIANGTPYTSTNTIHRVNLKADVDMLHLAIGLMSTFGQLSAEVEGRSYGAGVLKLEPSDARRLQIPLPAQLSRPAVATINRLLRSNAMEEARRVADRIVLGPLNRMDQMNATRALEEALQETRSRRLPR